MSISINLKEILKLKIRDLHLLAMYLSEELLTHFEDRDYPQLILYKKSN